MHASTHARARTRTHTRTRAHARKHTHPVVIITHYKRRAYGLHDNSWTKLFKPWRYTFSLSPFWPVAFSPFWLDLFAAMTALVAVSVAYDCGCRRLGCRRFGDLLAINWTPARRKTHQWRVVEIYEKLLVVSLRWWRFWLKPVVAPRLRCDGGISAKCY